MAPFADNLVRLLDDDHIASLLWGGDQLLHAVKVEESGTSVIESEASDFYMHGCMHEVWMHECVGECMHGCMRDAYMDAWMHA